MLVFDDELCVFEYVKVFEEDFFDDVGLVWFISLFGMVYVFLYLLDDFIVNVNLRYWREDVVNELFCKIIKWGKYILFNIEVII